MLVMQLNHVDIRYTYCDRNHLRRMLPEMAIEALYEEIADGTFVQNEVL